MKLIGILTIFLILSNCQKSIPCGTFDSGCNPIAYLMPSIVNPPEIPLVTYYARTPDQFQNLRLWLVADDIVQSNLTPVTSWNDRSSDKNHFTQNEPLNSPSFIKNQINGRRSVVRFYGGNNLIRSSSTLDTSIPVFTVFLIFTRNQNNKFTIFNAGNLQPDSGSDSLHLECNGYPNYNFSLSKLSSGSVAMSNFSLPNQSSPYLVGVETDQSATVGYTNFHFQGVKTNSVNGISNTFTHSTALTIGSNSIPSDYFAGDIAEIVYYNRILSKTELRALICYFSLRYGIYPSEYICAP
jgi:hypothetical protein